MILYEDISVLKNKYCLYTSEMLSKISNPREDIKIKVRHGLVMSDQVANATIKSGLFNQSYEASSAIDGLLHDIGRFEQYLLSGTLKDYDSIKYTGCLDHGKYGKVILKRNDKELLKYFLSDTRIYDDILLEVIGEHTTITNPDYQLPLDTLLHLFQNYSLEEILRSSNQVLKNQLIALKLLILREQDSLEILEQVAEELWHPAIGSEDKYHINDITWDLFTNFAYLDMKSLKEQGLWTCNSGFLLRYSLLLRNINFVGTLKSIIDNHLIDEVYEKQIHNVTNEEGIIVPNRDSKIPLAYEYIKLAINNLIATSPDGIIITDKSKQLALKKTLKEFNN